LEARAEGLFPAGSATRGTTKTARDAAKRLRAEAKRLRDEASDPAGAAYDAYFETQFPKLVRERIESGVEHVNPEVEAYVQYFSKWVQTAIGKSGTRKELRRLVSEVPTGQASPFNRSQALVVSLLKDKIEDASADVFRLAEMQTKRSVLERSINHPLFGLYPASYMWGKVLPETVKFIAKNPYAATYVIADVQRAIAIQREYDREMDDKIGTVDRSAGAFLLDYLTPGLPWSDHQSRMSPLFRGIMNGKDIGQLWQAELDTVSPQRWVAQVVATLNELPGAAESLTTPPQAVPQWQNALQGIEGVPAPTGGTAPEPITGPTKASALAPILEEDLSRLQSILLQGESPEK
jgi:hypothetical protein